MVNSNMFTQNETYQEGIDILMFKVTGMVGLGSLEKESNITIYTNCRANMNVSVTLKECQQANSYTL